VATLPSSPSPFFFSSLPLLSLFSFPLFTLAMGQHRERKKRQSVFLVYNILLSFSPPPFFEAFLLSFSAAVGVRARCEIDRSAARVEHRDLKRGDLVIPFPFFFFFSILPFSLFCQPVELGVVEEPLIDRLVKG